MCHRSFPFSCNSNNNMRTFFSCCVLFFCILLLSFRCCAVAVVVSVHTGMHLVAACIAFYSRSFVLFFFSFFVSFFAFFTDRLLVFVCNNYFVASIENVEIMSMCVCVCTMNKNIAIHMVYLVCCTSIFGIVDAEEARHRTSKKWNNETRAKQ